MFRKDNFLICVQSTKTSSIMKRREYYIIAYYYISNIIIFFLRWKNQISLAIPRFLYTVYDYVYFYDY